jgi:alkanesulfonate monooxygenase SsuD/methylene tetrahydromethanopterin reductase-like flavin-dependent oxidoreductase (luciferase family)
MSDGIYEFGLFDIMQVETQRPTAEVLAERLGHHREADRLGLDYVMLAERHFMSHHRASSPGLLLAHLSATTERIRLGVLAYTLALHNPVLLAEEISTLDHLTRGRLEVGLGLGHRPQEIAALGLPAEHRQPIFIENLMIMRQAWEGQAFNFDGGLYRLSDIWVDPPFQRPHPPLWFAGNDPQVTAWAARNGLSLAVGFQPDESLTTSTAAYWAETPPEGAPRQRVALMRYLFLAEDSVRAREEFTEHLIRVNTELRPLIGGSDASRGPLSRAEAEGQYEEQLARQVVIAGDPEDTATAIAASLRTLRANVFLANIHFALLDDDRIRRILRLYAEEVVPRVKAKLAE